jgi:hypothetical protein
MQTLFALCAFTSGPVLLRNCAETIKYYALYALSVNALYMLYARIALKGILGGMETFPEMPFFP